MTKKTKPKSLRALQKKNTELRESRDHFEKKYDKQWNRAEAYQFVCIMLGAVAFIMIGIYLIESQFTEGIEEKSLTELCKTVYGENYDFDFSGTNSGLHCIYSPASIKYNVSETLNVLHEKLRM